MPRFDVYRNPSRKSRERVPLLLDVQAGLLEGLATRLVVPLVPAADYGPPIERLNPVLRFANGKPGPRGLTASIVQLSFKY